MDHGPCRSHRYSYANVIEALQARNGALPVPVQLGDGALPVPVQLGDDAPPARDPAATGDTGAEQPSRELASSLPASGGFQPHAERSAS
jgi:hypothetical protein